MLPASQTSEISSLFCSSARINSGEEIIPEQLNLTVSLRGTRDVREKYQLFRLTGLLDAFSEPVFRKVMTKCLEDSPHHIILDMSKIDFLDSSGLGVLVQLAKVVLSELPGDTLEADIAVDPVQGHQRLRRHLDGE